MTDIYRTYRHTVVTCIIADLKTGRVKEIDYELHKIYKDPKTMQTKLENALFNDNKMIKLLGIKSTRIKTITYYMKPETFKANADYYTVIDGDNKENNNKKKRRNKK